MINIIDRFRKAHIASSRVRLQIKLSSIPLAAVCLVFGSVAMGQVRAQTPSAAPAAPSSPSALNPSSGSGYLQKDKKVPPSEKLSDWPNLKRDQVSPTPRAPCPGKADCKLVPLSHEEATKRLGHAPPTSDSSHVKPESGSPQPRN